MAESMQGDLIEVAEGTVVEFDMREICLLIIEGTCGLHRAKGATIESALAQVSHANPEVLHGCMDAARMVLNYIEDQLAGHGAVMR